MNSLFRICLGTRCYPFLTIFLTFGVYLVVQPGKSVGKENGTSDPTPDYKKLDLPVERRVEDLVRRMTLEEKVSQIQCETAAIPRLGIPAYSHRNECLHGLRNGIATVFPQAIGMAATWNTSLIRKEADTIATEARAKHNDYVAKHNGDAAHNFGISFYTPNINLFRDPRWGRGQETYGEDPFLTGQIGVAFIRGLQGDDTKYIKAMAGAKHYAVHSGPEPERHRMNMIPPERDLYETYLPAFEAAVREGKVGSIMGAYSALYGKPACASPFLLTKILRKQWGFDGYVVSDGGAIWDIWAQHKYVKTPEEAAAVAVKAGCDFSSGNVKPTKALLERTKKWSPDALGWVRGGEDYSKLVRSVQEGLVSEKEIDKAVSRELTARFRLGLFDPPSMVPWSKITLAQNDTPENRALALKVAEESIVLLKNNDILPLKRANIKRIAVIGPNADSTPVLLGNYHGKPSRSVTILEGIQTISGSDIEVIHEKGCPIALKPDNSNKPTLEMIKQVVTVAESADIVVFVGGIDSNHEGEQGNVDETRYTGFYRGDRTQIELPEVQTELLKALHATGKPVILVNCSGSAMAMTWEAENLPAIVQAWYPGEEGGRAVAEVLFGDVNPAGRLPVTFYRSTEDLPPFEDYSMENRTYRYFTGKPLFAFGHGLSYTKFEYSGAKIDKDTVIAKDAINLTFMIKNTGTPDGDEVPQVYFRHVRSAVLQPKQALCGFTRITLAKGETKTITIDIPVQRFRYWDVTQKKYIVEPGKYELLIGAASDDIRLRLPFDVKGE